ncbi:MAG: hypothetical protein ACXW0Z_07320 [Gemmatirosa sp.]
MRASRRPRAVLVSAVLAAALSLAACASAPAGSTTANGGTDFRRLSRGRASDVSMRHIQGEALTRDPSRSLMDVMASYWPTSMRGDPFARQIGGDQGIGAYVNGNYMGGWDFLRTVRAGELVRVQRLTQSEEYLKFGRTHPNGAVELTFRGGLGR